jgi:hypothetical protein
MLVAVEPEQQGVTAELEHRAAVGVRVGQER